MESSYIVDVVLFLPDDDGCGPFMTVCEDSSNSWSSRPLPFFRPLLFFSAPASAAALGSPDSSIAVLFVG
jgi:hypothetical protein